MGSRAVARARELEELVARYGQVTVLEDSGAVYKHLRRSTDPSIRRVIAILDRCGRGLEHEALLIGADA